MEREFKNVMRTIQRSIYLCMTLVISTILTGCLEEDSSADAAAGEFAISFTNPADAELIQTADIVVNISGTVSGASDVEYVQWQNNRGGRGHANGKLNWVTGNIVLKTGTNDITFTAKDSDGQLTSKTLTVVREEPGQVNTDTNVVSTNYGVATLSWNSPTSRTDGSALTNLAGFNIYYGRELGDYDRKITVDNPGLTTFVVQDLAPGTWHFILTAVDKNGMESEPSRTKSRTI
jgi:hypothetical protein